MGNMVAMTECCCIPDQKTRNLAQDRSILNAQEKQKRALQKPYESDASPSASSSLGLEIRPSPAQIKLPLFKPEDSYHKNEKISFQEQLTQESTQISFEQKTGEDFSEWLWDGPEDSDEEIQSMIKYKTAQEEKENVKFSKRGLINLIQKKIKEEHPDYDSNWKQELNIPSISYYLKKNGSHLSKTQPFFRSELTFPKVFKQNKLMRCLFSQKLQDWDENISHLEYQQIDEGKTCYHKVFITNKKNKLANINARDFCEKRVLFVHDGVMYKYSSSLPNRGLDERPEQRDTVRGETLLNFGMMWRDEKDGKIKSFSITQCDFKMDFPAFLVSSFLPKASKAYADNAAKYYNKNHKNL